MKTLLIVAAAIALCSCSAVPISATSTDSNSLSFGRNGASGDAMHHRSFYLDHDETPQWMKAAPHTNQ